MKVKIKTWNAVATWRWDIPDDDVCGICQVHFDGTCPTCKYPGDDCSLCKCIYLPGYATWRRIALLTSYSVWQMRPQFPHGETWSPRHFFADNLMKLQHCIIEWIKQDSAKGQCPMCRQSRNYHVCVYRALRWSATQNSNGMILPRRPDRQRDNSLWIWLRAEIYDKGAYGDWEIEWNGHGVEMNMIPETSTTMQGYLKYIMEIV